MTINNLRKWKAPAVLLAAALLITSIGVSPAYAAVSMSSTDPVIVESNSDSTVIAAFSPELGSTIESGTSTDAVAYYGVVANSSASSSDVFWRITVSHATSSLLLGDVDITEKGWYDDFGHDVADSPYTPLVNLDGDLVLTGNSGWGVEAGANFTNVDEISFAPTAPTGDYTITRELMDNTLATSTPMGGTHVLTVELLAAAPSGDTIAPLAPVVTSPLSPHSTTTNPITVSGTAEASSTIAITGGASDSSATTTGLGQWSATVNLNENATNTLMITATDDSDNTSSSTTLIVTHSTSTATTTPPVDDDAPSAPVVTTGPLCSTSDNIEISGTAEAGSTITITNNGATTTATTTAEGNWSATLPLMLETVSSFSITAMDLEGNESATTTVQISQGDDCPAPGGGGGGGGSRNDDDDEDDDDDNNNTSSATGNVQAGSVEGATTFVSPLNPFQQVLGASTFIPGIPNTGAGGNVSTNLTLLLASLGLVAIGTQVLRRRSQDTR